MLTLAKAQHIVSGVLAEARRLDLLPVTVVVLDARAAVLAAAAEDGCGVGRFAIARGKANGALAMGLGSRTLAKRAQSQPALIGCFAEVIEGGLVPAPGGVLVRDANGGIIGAIGVSGDVSDHDEAAAVAGIEAVALTADPGSDG